ncbi:Nitrilase/cyanide hydratase and apolipoprotein N-acyltransferase (plasmid) [Ketogulonicigenium robustum]|uniref:Nitrilase/cyanide hydratase and apolipoprotein N-acyltransferase n=1 Tax=Ketogulonicigenium robustum TaxID=92947 RepID=A0A1W6P329_9RHOB|nr:nitrilase-related carbon-nitrogen hydrolase [Ketogulonicigenium robustum]ARO15915.1 Nitrilase/cyanide hydratase and apolipoprotein N-acyltransferase [Ketogulonicigenium robustum]
MKLGVYQSAPTDGDTAGTFATIARVLADAAGQGAQMLLLPELMLPGYNHPALHAILAQSQGGPWIAQLQSIAAAAGCGITLGWAERAGTAVYNAVTAIGPDGKLLGHYRKIQLFGAMERASFTPSDDGYVTFDLHGRRFGLLICYDVEFAAHAAALRDRGARVILVPTANPAGYEHVQRVLVPARAYEARAIIAYANFSGDDAGLHFGGGSLVAGPDAGVMASAPADGPALLVVDLAAADAIDGALLSTQDADYRPQHATPPRQEN